MQHIEFKVFLIVNLLSLILYSLGVGLVMKLRKCPSMDRKAWWNIGINQLSFAFKSIAWIEILLAYDPVEEERIGPERYDDLLWNSKAHWFLFDYFGTYLTKMSIYAFIFEMRHVSEILTSDSLGTYQKRRRLRVRWMWTVLILQTISILVIEVYNYLYLIELHMEVKSGYLGYIYQGVKVAVMSIDLGMILMLWLTFSGLLKAKAKSNNITEQTRSFVRR